MLCQTEIAPDFTFFNYSQNILIPFIQVITFFYCMKTSTQAVSKHLHYKKSFYIIKYPTVPSFSLCNSCFSMALSILAATRAFSSRLFMRRSTFRCIGTNFFLENKYRTVVRLSTNRHLGLCMYHAPSSLPNYLLIIQ